MRYFSINNPVNDKEQRIYYNSKSNKKELLQKVILNYWEDYCNSHWIWQGKFESHKWNYEDKVKRFLNRCANFLLIGNYSEGDILSGDDIAKIKANEYSLNGDWIDENNEIELEEIVNFLNRQIKNNYSTDNKILETKHTNKPKKRKLNTESKTSRLNKIYTRPSREVIDYQPIHISNTFNVWDRNVKTIEKREGIIDKTKPYIAKWCIVDTEGCFMFNNNKYKILEEVSQYSMNKNNTKLDDYKNEYQMDKILVYEQNNNLYFFDQNIIQIENKYIKRL